MKKTLIVLIATFLCAVYAYATVVGNLKYDVVPERITVSCADHRPPQVRVLNPASGSIVVVDCEREK